MGEKIKQIQRMTVIISEEIKGDTVYADRWDGALFVYPL